MAGKVLIYISFFASLISLLGFVLAHLGKEKFINIGRIFFHITSIGVITSAVFLLYLILTHQFQYSYVWEQSSTDLQLPLLISTFYAGQEGSFMLWALFTAVIGVFLLNYVSKGDRMEPQVMSVYTLVLSFLTLILILKTPFNFIWESFPKEVEFGFIPPEGRGLNPLLQNFWMSIHPPTLFIGFAALAVPFAFAIAALMKNEYRNWLIYSMPWLLFAGGVLGLGIMMGGYWAYSILGWGGYWAWDPVENSSLIPWIISTAAIHTMLAQKKTGKYVKTNLILNILSFLLVLYSTFLTRSGILGESSVHSFVDPGAEVYLALVIFISSFILISVFAMLFRLKSLASIKTETATFFSKETFLFIGSMLLCASALIVFAGTSWPLVSKGKIEIDFYNKMNLPVGIFMMIIMGLTLYIEWKNTDLKRFLNNLIIPAVLSVLGTIILIIIGLHDPLYIIFGITSIFAFIVNARYVIRIIKKGSMNFGGVLTHIGIALFFLGVIGSGRYSEEVNLALEMNKPKEAFGYQFTYTGATPFMDPNNKKDTMYAFNVRIEKDNKEMILRPVMYFSQFSNGIMKNPDLANFAFKDLYISPISLEEPSFGNQQMFEFRKGEKKLIGDYEAEFIDFDFGNMQKGGQEMMSGNYTIGAKFRITGASNSETITLKSTYVNGEPDPAPTALPFDDKFIMYFINMSVKGENMGGTTATIAVVDNSKGMSQMKEETLVISAAVKPFISVLWTGVLILFVGFILSIIRRKKELQKN